MPIRGKAQPILCMYFGNRKTSFDIIFFLSESKFSDSCKIARNLFHFYWGGEYQLNIFLHVTQTETQHAGEWCDPWPWDIK